MAIKHKILVNHHGKIEERTLRPMTAIEHQCRECMNFQPDEVDLCENELCAIYPFRNKTARITKPVSHRVRYIRKKNDQSLEYSFLDVKLTPIKAIRYFCRECCGFERLAEELTNCQRKQCSLWPFRMGKNPSCKNRKGNFDALRKYQAKKSGSDNKNV